MLESTVIEQFNRELLGKLKVLYDRYVSLKTSLSKLPKDSKEARETKASYDDVIKAYNKYSQLHQASSKFTKLEQIEDYQKQIKEERSRLLDEYEELKAKYSEGVKSKISVSELNKIALRANEILKTNSLYNEMLSMFDKPLSMKSQITSVTETKKKIKEAPKKVEKVKTRQSDEKKKETPKTGKKSYSSDPDVLALHTMNRKIQGLKDMYYKMDSKSQEAKKIKLLLYNLCTEREEMVTKLLGYDATNKMLSIESLEDAAFSKENTSVAQPFQVQSKSFGSDFSSLVEMLGDLEFNGLNSETFKKYVSLEDDFFKKLGRKSSLSSSRKFKKCYDSLLKRYRNILKTIAGNDKELTSMGQDLLGTLRLFNIKGGYSSFKAKHKDGKIGSEAISKEMYQEGYNKIKSLISSISSYGTKFIESKGGTITINDTEKTREQRVAEINEKYFEIYDMILESRKKTVASSL